MATAELTVTRLQQRAMRYMGWTKVQEWPAEIDPVMLANEAGEWLTSATPWNHLVRPPGYLDLVNGQGWCDLPADFARHVIVRGNLNSAYLIDVEQDMQAVIQRRSLAATGGARFVGCFVHTGPTVVGPKSNIRLEIGPVPDQDVSQAFLIGYGAGWTPCVDSNSHILVPSWVQGLYVRAFCEHLGGWEREKDGKLEDRLDRLEASSLFRNAVDRDDTIQTSYGQPVGTAEAMVSGVENMETIYSNRNNVQIVTGS